MYTPAEAIKAIKARINGEWDNEWLLVIGDLSTNTLDDIIRIIDNIID